MDIVYHIFPKIPIITFLIFCVFRTMNHFLSLKLAFSHFCRSFSANLKSFLSNFVPLCCPFLIITMSLCSWARTDNWQIPLSVSMRDDIVPLAPLLLLCGKLYPVAKTLPLIFLALPPHST